MTSGRSETPYTELRTWLEERWEGLSAQERRDLYTEALRRLQRDDEYVEDDEERGPLEELAAILGSSLLMVTPQEWAMS